MVEGGAPRGEIIQAIAGGCDDGDNVKHRNSQRIQYRVIVLSHNQPATSKLEIIKSQKKPRTCSPLSRGRALCLRRAGTNSKMAGHQET